MTLIVIFLAMAGGRSALDVKRTSVLRRIPPSRMVRYVAAPGLEGCICALQLALESPPIVVEAVSGRAMTWCPGDIFLATPGYRESTRWVVGGISKRGLGPGRQLLGVRGSGDGRRTRSGTSRAKSHLGQVKYLGTVVGDERPEL